MSYGATGELLEVICFGLMPLDYCTRDFGKGRDIS